jgi:phosphoglycolate phosphatase
LKKNGLLLDLDGTLINSLIDICAALNHVRQTHSLPDLPENQIRSFIGKGADHLIRGCFPQNTENEQTELVEEYRSFYFKNPYLGGSVYPDVPSTLATLRWKGYELAVVTNKPTGVAEKTLAHYLPDVAFSAVMGPEKVTRHKPDPSHILETLELLNIDRAHACFVGDDPVDAQCAEAAGVRFFGAVYGFGDVQVPEKQRLARFADLLMVL